MHVGIISYQTGHLKTCQVLGRLVTKQFRISLFSFPFEKRPRKTNGPYEDRPYQIIDIDVKAFCENHGIGYREIGGWDDPFAEELASASDGSRPDVFITCIAKIIPASFIDGRTFLNAHPGLLPQNRGVDAFKWSIVNGWPIGVTLHIIDEYIDRGTILHRVRVPVLSSDSLSDVCERAYDMEGALLGDFDDYLENRKYDWKVSDEHPGSHKRIPREMDDRIEEIFLERRAELMRASTDLSTQPHEADEFDKRHPD